LNTDSSFLTLSGEDSNALDMIELGGSGVISVASNLIPKDFCRMISLGLDQKYSLAKRINDEISIIYDLLSEEGNPVSLKAGLEVLKICQRTVKPPLFDASDELITAFEKVLT